jgi:heptosyltransferase II
MARSSESSWNEPAAVSNGGSNAKPARILIVLPNWVGDLVLATPALSALRQHYADQHIAVVVKSHLAPVLSGGEWMNETLFWPSRDPSRPERRRSFLGFAADLRERRFDMAILLANSFRSALLAGLANIKRRVGYDRDGRGLLLTDKLLPQKADGKFIPVSMIRYYNAVARYLGCRECPELPELFTTPQDESAVEKVLAQAGIASGRPIVVINAGASFGPAKCWLPERFAEVADRLAERHNAAVVISCGPREIAVARAVVGRMRRPATVLDNPVMPLGPSKALIRRAALLVTNDTGPRHFANAFGTPVVTIFGPTDPQWTATPAASERSLMVPVDCGPCMKRKCPLDHRCMTRISSDMVLDKADELLVERTSKSSTI